MTGRRELVFRGVRSFSIDAAEPAALGRGDVRIAPIAVGICGSDVHGYVGANARRSAGMVMGHEAVGRIVETGSDLDPSGVGDIVTVNPAVTCGVCEACTSGQDNLCRERRLYGCVPGLPGAFADSFVVAAQNTHRFGGPGPAEWGALVEPIAVGDHAVGLVPADVDASGGLLILGGGPIGIGAALGARRRGIRDMVISEPEAHRRAVADQLGFQAAAPDALPRSNFAAAVECVAIPASVRAALERTQPGALISMVGMAASELPVPIEPLVAGERALKGSFNYTRAEFAAVSDWIASGAVDLAPVIQARVALEDLPGAFAAHADGSTTAMKTLFVRSR